MGTKSAWTDARRRQQSELIRSWAPWRKSTGPKTPEGKAIAAHRGYQGKDYVLSREFKAEMRAVREALRILRTLE